MKEDYKDPNPKKNPHDDMLDAMLQAKLAADKQYYAQDVAAQQAMRNAAIANQIGAMQGYSSGMQNIANQMHMQDAQLGRGLMAGIQSSTIGGPVEARHDPYVLAEGAMRRAQSLERRLDDLTYRIERLSGFYHWVTEVHPEMAAQYKAMRDLYDAANGDGEKMKSEGV